MSGIDQVSGTRYGACGVVRVLPASENRQGRKLRYGDLRQCGTRYGDLNWARVVGHGHEETFANLDQGDRLAANRLS